MDVEGKLPTQTDLDAAYARQNSRRMFSFDVAPEGLDPTNPYWTAAQLQEGVRVSMFFLNAKEEQTIYEIASRAPGGNSSIAFEGAKIAIRKLRAPIGAKLQHDEKIVPQEETAKNQIWDAFSGQGRVLVMMVQAHATTTSKEAQAQAMESFSVDV